MTTTVRTVLTDRNNQLIGYLITSGRRTVLIDRNNQLRGYYDAPSNTTTDHNNQLIGHGNLLMTLLPPNSC